MCASWGDGMGGEEEVGDGMGGVVGDGMVEVVGVGFY